MSKRWSAAEVIALRALYPDHRTAAVAVRLCRSEQAVSDKARRLGLHKLEPHPRQPERPSTALRAEIEAAKREWATAPPYEGWRRER